MILINSSPRNALRIFQPFLPIYVPVGLGYLAAMAEREGIEAHIIDEQVEDDAEGRVAELVKGMRPPYLFGFSVLTAALKSAVEMSKRLKERYPDSIVCFGGIHPTAAADEVLSFPQVDVVIRGEGEYSLMELSRCVREGRDYRHIRNLSYRDGGRTVHNECAPLIEDLDALPPFPYHRFREPQYDLGFIISSRGCPYGCIFCSNRVTTGRKYRIRSAESIIREIEMLSQVYGKRQILFLDDNLLVDRGRIKRLLQLVRQRGFDKGITYSFQARGDNVDRELLQELYASGFRSVFFGLETSSERIMQIIQKGESVAQCAAAVRTAREIGFHVSATFIFALPGESHEDRMDCVRLSRELRLDMVRFNNATPYPGTRLYEMAKQEGRLNIQGLYENFVSVSTFVENPFRRIPFSYVPAGNTENEIRRDILFGYFSHYLDISRLKAIFARPDLGVGWFNAGYRLRELLRKLPALFFLGLMLFFKLGQLFYYAVLKRETAISVGFFLRIFSGLWKRCDDARSSSLNLKGKERSP